MIRVSSLGSYGGEHRHNFRRLDARRASRVSRTFRGDTFRHTAIQKKFLFAALKAFFEAKCHAAEISALFYFFRYVPKK